MSLLRARTLLPILSLLSLLATRSDAAAMYTYTDLGNIDPQAINAQGTVSGHSAVGSGVAYTGYGPDAGQVVAIPGAYDVRGSNAQGQVIGVTATGTSYLATPIPGAGGPPSYSTVDLGSGFPNGINDLGQVVGQSAAGHAYLASGGQTTDLGTLGGNFSSASAINAFGQVVGVASLDPTNAIQHAFLVSGGKMTDLGTLGGTYSAASGINAAGQVIGTSMTASGDYHPFLYSNGQMIDLGAFGGHFSTADAINAAGAVVGYSTTTGGIDHAFLYSNGVMQDLNSLVPLPTGWTIAMAFGINDAGQIIGVATDPNGSGHGFLLTPAGQAAPVPPAVPEPTSLAVFGLAATGFLARRATRRRAA